MPAKDAPKPVCGIVMPISAIDGCSEDHWTEVHEILNEAIANAGFSANLVSNADDVGIIQKRIIQNLYDNPMVICDVSGKNPNVMFELGLRLAFDRPTIIVKDDKTSYTFDTSPIEHLEYPRDLRFSRIVEFKTRLSDKLQSTHQKASKDSDYTTFLKHFGEFKVAKIDKKEVSAQEFIIDELKNLRLAVGRLDNRAAQSKSEETLWNEERVSNLCGGDSTEKEVRAFARQISRRDEIYGTVVEKDDFDMNHFHLKVVVSRDADKEKTHSLLQNELLKKPSVRPRKRAMSRKDKSQGNGA